MIVTSQKFSWSVSTRQNSPQERILVDCLLGTTHHDCDKSEILMGCIYQAEFTPREDSRGLSARHYSPWLWQVRNSHGVYLPGRIHPKRGFSWTVCLGNPHHDCHKSEILMECIYQAEFTPREDSRGLCLLDITYPVYDKTGHSRAMPTRPNSPDYDNTGLLRNMPTTQNSRYDNT